MTERATCWSITINNPTPDDMAPELPPGWQLQGQLEVGEQGTQHYQGMLTTPQVRFAALKKVLPRAHIEIARNRKALEKYVHKDDTRVGLVDTVKSRIPTLFEYQDVVAQKWDNNELFKRFREMKSPDLDEAAMEYCDSLVAQDIEAGVKGVEFIAINPMWRASWKKFWSSIIKRNGLTLSSQGSPHAASSEQAACSSSDSPGGEGSSGSPPLSGDVPTD